MAIQDLALPHGYRLAFHENLDSTNSEALRLAGQGEENGLWVWALSQSAGRGRLARSWESPTGNLYASLLLRPGCQPMTASQLGFVAGVALYETVVDLAGGSPKDVLALKWPNDLLFANKKTGGILLESGQGEDAFAVVIGIGLNLSSHPRDAAYPATDLSRHGIAATPAKALERLVHACGRWLNVWNAGRGFGAIRKAWMERSLPAGAPVEVKLADGSVQGNYTGLDETGAFILSLADGTKRTVTTGDVFPL